MSDLYGNPEQAETPTTLILEKRRGNKLDADNHFKLGTKVYPNLSRSAVVQTLKSAGELVEGSKAERFRFEFVIEEIIEVKKE